MKPPGDPRPRIPGLHPGAIRMADDFDAPLPDEFWLGAEGEDLACARNQAHSAEEAVNSVDDARERDEAIAGVPTGSR